MNKDDIKLILKEQNIQIPQKLNFKSENEKLTFLNKIKNISKKQIKLKAINNEIKDIINDISLNEQTYKILKKINWEDWETTILNTKKNNRQQRIYDNFIKFIKTQLGLITPLETTNKKKTSKETDIFHKKENFNKEEDLIKKASKYNVNIIFDYTQKGKKNTINDFILYFNKRLQYFSKLLEKKVNTENIMRISQLKDMFETNQQVTIIGLISEIKYTKNNHLMITLEDKSSQIKCFIHKNKLDPKSNKYDKELAQIIENLCLDEGIAIVGKIGKEIIWTDNIIIPSPPNNQELKKTQETNYIACISDLHLGAKVFQEEAFQKFLDWLNEKTQNEKLNEIAKKVKYILIPGDLIEGLGIYPGQGKDAKILSTELQYTRTAQLLSQIPNDKCIIIIPGNHDTTRLSEPQLKLPYHKAYALYNLKNLICLSNPSIIKLFKNDPSQGLEFYLYHGSSIFYYADTIKHLREKGGAKNPQEVIKYLLNKRHLAPSHGSTLYLPDSQQDPLIIPKMPDFFITGHTHKLNITNYKGCTILNCGCWVEMSDYQEKMGMYPDIGKCILINTQTRETKILNFYKKKE
jgi:DNA polymerase II small subunit